MKKLTIALVTAPMALFSAAALAGDAEAGAAKAEACLDCHEAADFEGLSADDIAGKLSAFLAGEAKHPSVELDAADVPDIAAYFAAEAAK